MSNLCSFVFKGNGERVGGKRGGGGRVLTHLRDGVIMDRYSQKYGLNFGSNSCMIFKEITRTYI